MASGLSQKNPVCKVCGDESSGFHYGVDSCEGCKGFFRRCITQGMHHRCNNGNRCDITPFTRNSCQYCRLTKCFAVGMCREASRLGRRPKKMREASSDGGTKTNVPIAPYPSQPELLSMRMADVLKILERNGTYNSEVQDAFLAAQAMAQTMSSEMDSKVDVQQTDSAYSCMTSSRNSTEESPVHYAVSQSNPPPLVVADGSIIKTTQFLSQQPVVNGHHNLHPAAMTTHFMSQQPVSNGHQQLHPTTMTPIKGEMDTTQVTCGGGGMFMPSSDNLTSRGIDFPSSMSTSGVALNNSVATNNDNQVMGMKAEDSFLNSNFAGTGIDESELSKDMDMLPSQPPDPYEVAYYEANTPETDRSTEMPLLLPANSNVTTPSPLLGNPFFESNFIDLKKMMDFVQAPLTDRRCSLMHLVIRTITDAHMATCSMTRQLVSDSVKVYNEQKMLHSMGDFEGLKINPDLMWQQFLSYMVPEITRVVKFSKKLPGFPELTQDDQIILIKQGSFEVLLVRFLLLIDTDTGEMFDPGMKFRCPRDVVLGMPMGGFLGEFFKLADRFNPLNLLDSEIAIFTAILLMCPDRQNFSNRRDVARIQGVFYQALYLQLQVNHEDHDNIFICLVNLIPHLKQINEQHHKALNEMKMVSPQQASQLPALHQEIYDVNV